jgi:hypothetical protein
VYKVVQIWPGQTVTYLHTNRPGHIWTTLYFVSYCTSALWERRGNSNRLLALEARRLHGCPGMSTWSDSKADNRETCSEKLRVLLTQECGLMPCRTVKLTAHFFFCVTRALQQMSINDFHENDNMRFYTQCDFAFTRRKGWLKKRFVAYCKWW